MLDSIKYVVVLMLENRSFDNILGGLYGVNQPTVFVPTSNTDSFDGILVVNVNDVISTVEFGKLKFFGIRFQTSDDDVAGTRLLTGDNAGKASLARPHNDHAVANRGLGDFHSPPESGTQRVKHHSNLRCE